VSVLPPAARPPCLAGNELASRRKTRGPQAGARRQPVRPRLRRSRRRVARQLRRDRADTSGAVREEWRADRRARRRRPLGRLVGGHETGTAVAMRASPSRVLFHGIDIRRGLSPRLFARAGTKPVVGICPRFTTASMVRGFERPYPNPCCGPRADADRGRPRGRAAARPPNEILEGAAPRSMGREEYVRVLRLVEQRDGGLWAAEPPRGRIRGDLEVIFATGSPCASRRRGPGSRRGDAVEVPALLSGSRLPAVYACTRVCPTPREPSTGRFPRGFGTLPVFSWRARRRAECRREGLQSARRLGDGELRQQLNYPFGATLSSGNLSCRGLARHRHAPRSGSSSHDPLSPRRGCNVVRDRDPGEQLGARRRHGAARSRSVRR